MKKIKNITDGLQHLPAKYAHVDANGQRGPSSCAPGVTITYDIDRLFADKPFLRALYKGVFEIEGGEAVVAAKPGPRAKAKAEQAKAEQAKAPNPYAEIDEAEAGDLIAALDAEELREWLSLETREGVIARLRAKLEG
jgi:hypothetical protein